MSPRRLTRVRPGAVLETPTLGAPGLQSAHVLPGRRGACSSPPGPQGWPGQPRPNWESWSSLLLGPCFKGGSRKNAPYSHYRVGTDFYSTSLLWPHRGNVLSDIFLCPVVFLMSNPWSWNSIYGGQSTIPRGAPWCVTCVCACALSHV